MAMTATDNLKWYALQVLTNQENKVKLYIDKFMVINGLSEFIDEVLVPVENVIEIKNGKRRQRMKKFYPGYVFIRMKLLDEDGNLLQDPWQFVRNTEGVVNFVGKDKPVPLKQFEVDRILEQVKRIGNIPMQRVSFEIGDRVKITDGPFIESTGNVINIDMENGKMKVSVSLFGRDTPVELEFWQANIINEE
ncbi:MAG: transcription termination/antitermination protein NusG [Puniceicoccales bacterium]|jgi:transcriptional antiterminator NusG|nr:transcription termination/antitermination protein NusG [Puniceicoccales bacterium]